MAKSDKTQELAAPRVSKVNLGQSTVNVLAFTQHDHARCKRSAMRAVFSLCKARNLKLTPVRRQTLEVLLESHNALGAYE